jgi:hypothetical protein
MLSEEGRNSPRSVRLSSPSDKLEEQAPQRDPHTEEGKVPFQLAESLRKTATRRHHQSQLQSHACAPDQKLARRGRG